MQKARPARRSPPEASCRESLLRDPRAAQATAQHLGSPPVAPVSRTRRRTRPWSQDLKVYRSWSQHKRSEAGLHAGSCHIVNAFSLVHCWIYEGTLTAARLLRSRLIKASFAGLVGAIAYNLGAN